MFLEEISHMIEMLCDLMGVEYNPDDLHGDDIQFFVCDLDFGKDWTPDCFTEGDGTSIDISTPEKLYDYIINENEKKQCKCKKG